MIYKVVKPDLSSCSASGLSCVEYKINRWVRAPRWLRDAGHHLCAFETMNWVERFLAGWENPDFRVFEAEGEGKCRKIPKFYSPYDLAQGVLTPMYKYNIYDSGKDFPIQFPIGTVFFKAIKLIREVEVCQ